LKPRIPLRGFFMRLKLERPLVVLDLETTGTHTTTDRIVEVAFIKLHPNGKRESKTSRVNPQMPIPREVSEIHGITDETVKDAPTFNDLAPALFIFLHQCDLAGFNSNKFDIPILIEEFHRSGYEFDVRNRNLIDVQNIFHKKEPRTLSAAFKFYCDQELENAHSAEADTSATLDVLLAQLEKYNDLDPNPEKLAEFSKMHNNVDLHGRFVKNDKGAVVFNFGKHKGKVVTEVLQTEPSYYGWMMKGDFSQDTKRVLQDQKKLIRQQQH
jgi:DNA polymerase-3 subunit epsilon